MSKDGDDPRKRPNPPLLPGAKAGPKPAKKWSTAQEAPKRALNPNTSKLIEQTKVAITAIDAKHNMDQVNQRFYQRILKEALTPNTLVCCAADMDGTFNFHPTPGETILMGGEQGLENLHALIQAGVMLKIISATTPSLQALKSLNADLVKLAKQHTGKHSLHEIFGTDNDRNIKPDALVKLKLLLTDSQEQEISIGSYHNLILSGYDKGYAMMAELKAQLTERLKEHQKSDPSVTALTDIKYLKVYFIDDYVKNGFDFSLQFIKSLNEIADIVPNAKIHVEGVWLQVPEHQASKTVKKGLDESSYQERVEPYRDFIEKGKEIPAKDFQKVFNDLLVTEDRIEHKSHQKPA